MRHAANDRFRFRLAMCQAPEKEQEANPDFELVRDYSALNKASLEAGITTSKEQSRFRSVFISIVSLSFDFVMSSSLHDIKKKVFIRDVSPTKNVHKFADDTVFGTPCRSSSMWQIRRADDHDVSRPSTPIGNVIQHRFREEWLEAMQNKQMALRKERVEATVNNLLVFFRVMNCAVFDSARIQG
jgi:hypothetical protein